MKMNSEVIAALISLLGAAVGTFGGIITSARLTNYRIRQLELRVEKHNGVVERTALIEEKIKVINHRINDLEGHH